MVGFLSILGALLLYVNVANAILIEGSSGSNEQTSDQNLSRVVNNYGSTIDMVNKNIVDQHLYGDGYGAAINNQGTINYIKGNFERNYISAGYDAGEVFGGAIYNSGKIGTIDGNFKNNQAQQHGAMLGGAIYNSGEISLIKGTFTSNMTGGSGYNSGDIAAGGAIYNIGKIGDIEADFYNNYSSLFDMLQLGSTIYNKNKINSIKGEISSGGNAIYNAESANIGLIDVIFTGGYSENGATLLENYGNVDYIKGTYSSSYFTGVIYNKGTITDITADFYDNTGLGVLINEGNIESVTGNFYDNGVGSKGAIYTVIDNSSRIDSLNGSFTNNIIDNRNNSYAVVSNNSGGIIMELDADFSNNKGTVIYNDDYIGTVTGDFVGNSKTSDGGIIHNMSMIENINANFENNSVITDNKDVYSAIVYNKKNGGDLTSVTGEFIANEVSYGGIIYNGELLGNISAEFIQNKVTEGAIIYNEGGIADIIGDFYKNEGDVIYNNNYIANIDGDFYENIGEAIGNNNRIESISGSFVKNEGVSISNSGTIQSIDGSFRENSGTSIYNISYINSVNADFVENYSPSSDLSITGGAIYNAGTIGGIEGKFENNYADSDGGAIYNGGTIGSLSGSFDGNSVSASSYSVSGGAIYNNGTIGDIDADFRNNYANGVYSVDGGAIYNNGTIGDIIGNFDGNYAINNSYSYGPKGGAIYNSVLSSIGVIKGSFKNNYVSAQGPVYYEVGGGAIYNDGGMVSRGEEGYLVQYSEILGIEGVFENNYAVVPNGNASGGAIYNSGGDYDFRYNTVPASIGYIKGDFIGNYISALSSAQGGAIYNGYRSAKIGDIDADFEGNYVEATVAAGGAILNENTASIGNITGNFVGNNAKGKEGQQYETENGMVYAKTGAQGGAINNAGYMADIIGGFIGNYVSSPNGSAVGGGISNYFNSGYYGEWGEIGNISGEFVGNYATANEGNALGGAIYNEGELGSINANFTDNLVSSVNGEAKGGAILNIINVTYDGFVTLGSIVDISGDFVGNYAVANGGNTSGGAIYNSGTIGDITGNFSNNNVVATGGEAKGGAIYNAVDRLIDGFDTTAKLSNITGDFSGNYISSSNSNVFGGAIYNEDSEIGDIKGDFTNNYAVTDGGEAKGGAIYNSGIIGGIEGKFEGNYVNDGDMNFDKDYGGAIYNEGEIDSIKGEFSANKNAQGGAIYNTNDIGVIEADFIGNGQRSSKYSRGGAIYNSGDIDGIKGDFLNNNISAYYAWGINSGNEGAYGGAIYNKGNIGFIEGNFENNRVGGGWIASGGAIYNAGTIDSIKGKFSRNSADAGSNAGEMAYGGAIYNSGTIGVIDAELYNNSVTRYDVPQAGGSLINYGNIGTLKGVIRNHGGAGVVNNKNIKSFESNVINNSYTYMLPVSGVINGVNGVITTMSGNFENNEGIALKNMGRIDAITGDFVGNAAIDDSGGAIYNEGVIGRDNKGVISGISSKFENNYANSDGGAVYNVGSELNFINSNFRDNYVVSNVEGRGGAIYSEALVNIIVDGEDTVFSGNYVEDINGKRDEAIYTKKLSIGTTNNGNVIFDDSVVVFGNDVTSISGDTSGEVVFNSKLDAKSSQLAVNNGAIIHMGKNADLNVESFVSDNASLVVDMAVDKDNKTIDNGVIHVAGDVIGTTGVIVNSENPDAFVGAKTVYVEALNDDMSTDSEFTVDRVVGSPYMWTSVRNYGGETVGSTWYLKVEGMDEEDSGGDDTGGDTGGDDVTGGGDNTGGDTGEDDVTGGGDNTGGDIGGDDVTGGDDTGGDTGGDDVIGGGDNTGGDTGGDDVTGGGDNTGGDTGGDDVTGGGDNTGGDTDGDDVTGGGDNTGGDTGGDDVTGGGGNTGGDTDGDDVIGGGDNTGGDNPSENEPSIQLKPIYTPEVVTFVASPTISVQQNRSIASSLANGLIFEQNKLCNDDACELETKKTAWIDIVQEKAEITAPQKVDAKVSGVTFGADVYRDTDDRIGVFGAVRDGKYELSGDGKYYSNIGSKIKTDSYLAGVYYKHHNENDVNILALAFVGKQDMDISTNDGVANASTDALQYGMSAEVSKHFLLSEQLDLEPSLGIFYTGADIDNMSDNVGKTAKYDMLHYLEAELGLKVEYKFSTEDIVRNVYIKPSVIQTIASGGKTKITGIKEKINTIDNQTLGRLEFGGEFGISSKISGYISAGYTFGSDYKSYDIKAGINYEF